LVRVETGLIQEETNVESESLDAKTIVEIIPEEEELKTLIDP
jgi:hypothetical protein